MVYIERKKHYRFVFTALLAILFIVMLAACSVGSADLNTGQALRIVIKSVPRLGPMLVREEFPGSSLSIILNLRMPRVLLAVFVGAALAFSGATFQGIFKNPMAESYVLGVSAGAALGGTLSIVMGVTRVAGVGGTGFMAFAGALLTTYLVYRLARTGGRVPTNTLLLAGIAVNFMLSAIISLLMILNRQRMSQVILWTMGSFASASWGKVAMAGSTMLFAMISTYFFSKDLNIMLMGEEEAKHLGIDVEKLKKILLTLASFLAAIAVSVSGIIGFVGLIVPHAVRMVTGPDHRVVLPFAAVTGGIFLVTADTLSRILASPMEIPVGVITALSGTPFFVYLLVRSKMHG